MRVTREIFCTCFQKRIYALPRLRKIRDIHFRAFCFRMSKSRSTFQPDAICARDKLESAGYVYSAKSAVRIRIESPRIVLIDDRVLLTCRSWENVPTAGINGLRVRLYLAKRSARSLTSRKLQQCCARNCRYPRPRMQTVAFRSLNATVWFDTTFVVSSLRCQCLP